MKREVLRRFRIATDAMGIQSTELSPGDVYDVPDDMAPALEAEGYIKPLSEAAELSLGGRTRPRSSPPGGRGSTVKDNPGGS